MLRSDYRVCNPSEGGSVIDDVLLPQMGLEVNEATVLDLLVAVGEEIAEGAALMELETDKATTELPAPRAGFVVALEVTAGDTVPVGAVLARIADAPDERPGERREPVAAPAVARGSEATPVSPRVPAGRNGARLRAAPVARRAAAKLGVALEAVTGTGPRGRITLGDVEAAAAGAGASPRDAGAARRSDAAAPAAMSRLRRAIARRMSASQLIPQYRLDRDVDVSHLLAEKEARAAAGGAGPKVGLNDLLMQAIAAMIVRHPDLASVYEDEPEPHLRRHDGVGVGLAVATDRGLVVPVIRGVESIGLREVAAQRQRLVAAARTGRLEPHEMGGAVITLSNLGSFGVDRFNAMLNPGESAIVAVGRTIDRVVARGRAITVVPTMTVTMSFDHRAIDGAVGGAALGGLAELLEGGMTWRP